MREFSMRVFSFIVMSCCTMSLVPSFSVVKAAESFDCGVVLRVEGVVSDGNLVTLLSQDGKQKYYMWYDSYEEDICQSVVKAGKNICVSIKKDSGNPFSVMTVNGKYPDSYSISKCKEIKNTSSQAALPKVNPGAQTSGDMKRACGFIKTIGRYDSETYSALIEDVFHTQGTFLVNSRSQCGELVKKMDGPFCFDVARKKDSRGGTQLWILDNENCGYAN